MGAIPSIIVFPALGVMLIRLAARSQPLEEQSWLMRVLLGALVLRLAGATAFELELLPRLYHQDAAMCELTGNAIAQYWSGDGPPLPPFGTHNTGFVHLCGAIYFITGSFRANAAYFVSIVSVLNVFLVYRLARKFFHWRVARFSALLTAFLPSIVMYGAMAVKEPVIIFLTLTVLSACVSLRKRATIPGVLGAILPIVLLQPLRFYIVYFLLVSLFVSLLIVPGRSSRGGPVKAVLVGGTILLLFAITGLWSSASEGVSIFSFQQLAYLREAGVSAGESGFSAGADVSTPTRAIAFLPLGLLSLLLGPLPWQFTNFRQLTALPELLLWWSLFPSVVRGLVWAVRRRSAELSPILLFCVSLTVAYALGQGEIGTAVRQRAQIFVLLFIFGALGHYQLRCRREGLDEELLLIEDTAHLTPGPVSIVVPRPELRPKPPGSTILAPKWTGRCTACGGRGRMTLLEGLGGGAIERPCIVCRGKGWIGSFHSTGLRTIARGEG